MEATYKAATKKRKSTTDSINKIQATNDEKGFKQCIDDALKKDIIYEGEKRRLIPKSKLIENYKLQELESMKIHDTISDEDFNQQMERIDQFKKPVFEKDVYFSGIQVATLHQKIKS